MWIPIWFTTVIIFIHRVESLDWVNECAHGDSCLLKAALSCPQRTHIFATSPVLLACDVWKYSFPSFVANLLVSLQCRLFPACLCVKPQWTVTCTNIFTLHHLVPEKCCSFLMPGISMVLAFFSALFAPEISNELQGIAILRSFLGN